MAREYKKKPPEERFWQKVAIGAPDECWLWTAAVLNSGYGAFQLHPPPRTVKAHRFSYELVHGPIPEGMVIRHTCDNPLCVNPEHLEIGTPAENSRDMFERGRSMRQHGTLNHAGHKLTEQQALAIYKATGSHSAIAKQYGVCQPLVSAIKRGVKWPHIASSLVDRSCS